MSGRAGWLNYMLATSVAFQLLVCVPAAAAADTQSSRTHVSSTFTPSGEAMLVDTVVARPAGLAMTLIGTGLFVLTLPFSIGGGNVEQAKQRFIDEPAAYTFRRCLGCLDDAYKGRHRWRR